MFKSKRFFIVFALALMVSAGFWAVGLKKNAKILKTQLRVPTIQAKNETDAMYALGFMHAKERFFQMDLQRRAFSGTLAELLGPAVLAQDVQLRTIGLRRAAERSLAVQTPEVMEWLEAYSDGVNAWLFHEAFGSDDEDSCSVGGVSSDDSKDGASAGSSDDESGNSGDSKGAKQLFHPLPPEYGVLEIDRDGIPAWTPLDSLVTAKGLAFNLSFDLGDIDRTFAFLAFLEVGEILAFNGLQLFSADLYPAVPFDPSVSIPPLGSESAPPPPGPISTDAEYLETPGLIDLLNNYKQKVMEIPPLKDKMPKDFGDEGSNWFLASGANTVTGNPLIANDPHLAINNPATFYEAHIQVKKGINVAGVTFPGAPGVVQGCTDTICWGSTVNPLDVTDVYQEVLLALGPDPTQPTHTLFNGAPEPLEFIPQTFLFNNIGDGFPNTLFDAMIPPESGGVTIIVPRRNNGPIVEILTGNPTIGISIQYTGFSATQELEAFRLFTRAESPEDFRDALQFFDVGSQNWGYADIHGNIAYFTSAELPIREDLQTLFFPDGFQAPFLIRDGTHTLKHEWLPVLNPQPHQAIDFEMLPFDEMPQIVNPESGIILNANNDPIGTSLDNVSWNQFREGFNGLLYLSPGYAPGYRMGRIQKLFDELLAGGGKVSKQDFIDVQANNQLLDAEFFTPYLVDAYANAVGSPNPALAALAADPRIAEAADRLADWDFSTPTGIVEGFDPGDPIPLMFPPSQDEIDASVAATIYSLFRGQLVQRVIDGTLASLPIPLDAFAPPNDQAVIAVQRLLLAYPATGGTGQSLINFFNEPDGATPLERRDLVLLRALDNALNLAASDEFAPAFANSTNLEDYRWGKLHRIVLDHPIGGPFNIPPTGGPGNLGPGLPGFARAGGMGAVDASSHSARADGLNEFMFGSGPSRRFVAEMTPDGPDALEVIPGGQSGIPGSVHQVDQLALWLVNQFHPLPLDKKDVKQNADVCQTLVPPVGKPAMIEDPIQEVSPVPDGGLIGFENEGNGTAEQEQGSSRKSIRKQSRR